MAYQTRYGNYVKFLRGTPTAWASIESKDSDTLYFIAEEGATVGKLYLGGKLIADGETATINTLKELTDVVIGAGVPNGAILAYDAKTNTWRDTMLETVLQGIIDLMVGATDTDDGVAGLVPQPKAGDNKYYLRGDGQWADPTVGLAGVVSSLQQTVENNQKAHREDIKKLLGSYNADPNASIEYIVDKHIAEVVGSAPDTFDTLEEIAKWISDHDGAIDIASTLTRLSAVENALNNTETGLIVQMDEVRDDLYGNGSKVGLVSHVTTLLRDVGKAQQDIIDLSDLTSNMQGDITAIYELLKWQDLYDTGA